MNKSRVRRRPRYLHRSSRLGNRLTLENLEERILLSAVSQNHPPVNLVPTAQNILEGGTLLFQNASANRISITDPDAGDNSLEVTLSASAGVFSLGDPGAVQFSKGDGVSDAAMVFRGSQSAINEALSSVTFVPPTTFAGAATLTISTNDLGHTGSGGAKSDTDKVTINVAAVNHAPSFTKGSDVTVLEDSGAQKISHWVTGISAGPGEQKQKLKFIVTSDNSALFSQQPAIDADGTLHFTTASNTVGSANVSVRLMDDGGTCTAVSIPRRLNRL